MRRGMRLLSKDMRPLSNLTRRTAMAALERASADARSMPGNLLPHDCLDDLTAAARRIVAEVKGLPEAPYDLTGTGDRPIDAAVIGLLVGSRLELPDEALLQLGLGLFLQDIGKLALPPSIVAKPDPLDHDEQELMRRHPELGLVGEEIPLLARIAELADVLAEVAMARSPGLQQAA